MNISSKTLVISASFLFVTLASCGNSGYSAGDTITWRDPATGKDKEYTVPDVDTREQRAAYHKQLEDLLREHYAASRDLIGDMSADALEKMKWLNEQQKEILEGKSDLEEEGI